MKAYQITVKEDEYIEYRTGKPVTTGEYLVLLSCNVEMKQVFAPIAVKSKINNKFYWLVPFEDWTARELLDRRCYYKIDDENKYKQKLENLIRRFYKRLHDWQRNFLFDVYYHFDKGLAFRKGLIVALGGGKTLVSLILCNLDINNSVYITPKHLKSSVIDEAKKWELEIPQLINPESVKKISEIKKIVILDESLSCKNPSSQRSKNVRKIFDEAEVGLAMTGTPLSICPTDIRWLRVFNEGFVPEQESVWKWRFGDNPGFRCPDGCPESKLPVRDNGEKIYPLIVDSWNVEEASKYCSSFLTTIKIDEIMKNVPPLSFSRVYLSKPRFYSRIFKGLLTFKNTSKRITQARTTTAGFVYNDAGEPIILQEEPIKIKWIKSFLEDNPGEPVVIFSNWRQEQLMLYKNLQKYNPALVNQEKKEVDKFTKGETDVLICSSGISEGMNLQRSRFIVFFSNSMMPVKRQQAIGRCYRQGQTRPVIVFDLICKDTLDEAALDLLEEHLSTSDKFIETQLIEQTSIEKNLIEILNKKLGV